MPRVTFHIHVDSPSTPSEKDCDQLGYDTISFDISPNVGEEPRPLAKIASGGELSRVLLAIKQVLNMKMHPITFIFDEIDAGIGGAIAEVVGKKLRHIGQKNQVLCITHLPQIASYAADHYVIEKEVKRGRTYTQVRVVGKGEREEEVARMLGGLKITAKTREHAREMLRNADIR